MLDGLLHGPTRIRVEPRIGRTAERRSGGAAERRSGVTMRAELELRLVDRRTGGVLHGGGHNAELEVHGDLDRLLALQVCDR